VRRPWVPLRVGVDEADFFIEASEPSATEAKRGPAKRGRSSARPATSRAAAGVHRPSAARGRTRVNALGRVGAIPSKCTYLQSCKIMIRDHDLVFALDEPMFGGRNRRHALRRTASDHANCMEHGLRATSLSDCTRVPGPCGPSWLLPPLATLALSGSPLVHRAYLRG
jgi:hypothetical protein